MRGLSLVNKSTLSETPSDVRPVAGFRCERNTNASMDVHSRPSISIHIAACPRFVDHTADSLTAVG